MRSVVVIWAVMILGAGCGIGKVCTDMGCGDSVVLHLVHQDGSAVEGFSGSVTLNNITHQFNCKTSTLTGPVAEGPVGCGVEGTLRIEGVAAAKQAFFITVLSESSGYFSQMVKPEYKVDHDYNGPDCGSCAHGESTIVLVKAPHDEE